MSTKKISRAQWDQIAKRVKQVNFVFDPKWKCLIDGKPFRQCDEHFEEDQDAVISAVRARLGS